MVSDWFGLKYENKFIKKIRCIYVNNELIYLIFINEMDYISEKLGVGPLTHIINNFLYVNGYNIKWRFENIENINIILKGEK